MITARCIAGVVCTMKYFVNNLLTGAERDAAQPYADIQGTKYGVFLGCAFGKGDAPKVTPSALWQWFYKYLAEKWNRKAFDCVESEQEDCDAVSRADKFSPTDELFAAQIYDAAAQVIRINTNKREVENFYSEDLPAIIKKLEAEPLADDVRRELLKIFLQWYQKFVEALGYKSADVFFFNAKIQSLKILIDTEQS